MIIYIFIALLGFLRVSLFSHKSSNKYFVVLVGSVLFFISSFRNINFGPDTRGYVVRYIQLSYENFSDLLLNTINGTGKDPFFYMFSKIISMIGANYQVWLAVIAGIFCFSVSKMIYSYSPEPYISYVALISLGYFYFSLTGLRQILALSIILFSYKYLRNRQLVPFVILVLFGSLFHSTAMIFLIAYPLVNIKIGWKQIIGILGTFILVYFFKNNITIFLNHLTVDDRYQSYLNRTEGLTISGFIIQLCIYLFCLLFKTKVLTKDRYNFQLYNLLFLGLVFQAFSTIIAEFFRISMYFSIFSIILIPLSIKSIKNKNIKVLVYLIVFSALIAFLFRTGRFREYSFYW